MEIDIVTLDALCGGFSDRARGTKTEIKDRRSMIISSLIKTMLLGSLLFISCTHITEPRKISPEKNISLVNHCFVYSINECQKDSIGNVDSILGVMIIKIGKVDFIRKNEVHIWNTTVQYFNGNKHTKDSSYNSFDYVFESDSFLVSLAYKDYDLHSGLLMKKLIGDQKDSVSKNGDSVLIENSDNKFFCKLPQIGFSWIQRPDWLRYDVENKGNVSVWDKSYDCFHIIGTPLDSHMVKINSGDYSHHSWVTPKAIIKTEIAHSLPDSVWDSFCYYRIELIEDIDNCSIFPNPFDYKSLVIERGWK